MFIHEWSSAQVILQNVNITCVVSNSSSSGSNVSTMPPACLATAVSDALALFNAVSKLQAAASAIDQELHDTGPPLDVRIVLQNSITVSIVPFIRVCSGGAMSERDLTDELYVIMSVVVCMC